MDTVLVPCRELRACWLKNKYVLINKIIWVHRSITLHITNLISIFFTRFLIYVYIFFTKPNINQMKKNMTSSELEIALPFPKFRRQHYDLKMAIIRKKEEMILSNKKKRWTQFPSSPAERGICKIFDRDSSLYLQLVLNKLPIRRGVLSPQQTHHFLKNWKILHHPEHRSL